MTQGILKVLGLGACVLALAAGASAQEKKDQKTLKAGTPTVTKLQVKGELVVVGTSWLIAKLSNGEYHVYDVKPGQQFTIDGVATTLAELKPGTMLTADVTITETPLISRTVSVNDGTVFWAAPKSVIITQANGVNRQYDVPEGFKFDLDGKQLSAMELRPGMKLSGLKITEQPGTVISTDAVVTGTAPKSY